MVKKITLALFCSALLLLTFSFRKTENSSNYQQLYFNRIQSFQSGLSELLNIIQQSNLSNENDLEKIKTQLLLTRKNLKQSDFWFRYFDPVSHKKINGPLPVEWETEVFEKFEKPYKRDGAGLTLAQQYLEEDPIIKDTLISLIKQSIDASYSYKHDTITQFIPEYHHFYLCNRLFLLNLATIYTTGFECPQTDAVIPELRILLTETATIYEAYNSSFTTTQLSSSYLNLYLQTIRFVNSQPDDYTQFDHYTFIRDYINPLFIINQQLIREYKVVSKSLIDYSLNKQAVSIFSKSLYFGQNPKGIFTRVQDPVILAEIDELGKQLFYDPLLSGNNERSCASCHKPSEFFTDTSKQTSETFNHNGFLPRKSPSLLNAQYNHLLMADGKHYTLQAQVKGVVSTANEMGCSTDEMVSKVMSCKQYAKTLNKLLKLTPQEKTVTADHIASAITFYYSKFSKYESPFDQAMNKQTTASSSVQRGFNIFMGKAQCATCHFAPQFNGVKPPYIGSEFEVLGVPQDSGYQKLSPDKGRYEINPATQTLFAFRTGTIRNAAYTKPYMHNGVFSSLAQVIDFYDGGGGAGRGFDIPNQTLSSDSLHLTPLEKQYLIEFIISLSENIPQEEAPLSLPLSSNKQWNTRKVGGLY